jgi:predicted Zn-dependent peptidase
MAFYASVLASHFDKAVDLLTDITFRSIFPEKEIEKEKRVILEEMAMYQDTPDDAIQDEFDALLFPGHPLGNNILGTEESVEAIRQTDFTDFFSQNISFDRLIFSSVGPFDLDTAVKIAAPHLESLEPRFCRVERQAPSGIILQKKEVVKPISQSHIMLGCRAYSLLHPNRLAFFLLNNVLGGPAMTSRLNFTIREKFGLVYGVESQYSPYLDTGSFSIYFATEPRNRARAEDLVWKEIRSLINKPLSANQLKNAKEQLKGQLAMAEEGNLSLMLMLGKSMMDMGKVQGLGEIFSEIDALRAEELQEIAIEAWRHDNWTQLSFIPEKNHSKK